MNRVSLISQRINRCKQTQSLLYQSVRNTTSFEHYHTKHTRPDRWRVEPHPIAEPYHHNTHTLWADPPRMDGGNIFGKSKTWTYHYKFIIQIYIMGALFFYIMRQYIEYENIFTWGKEEALSQMNYRSMRDEELIYLWVRYNQLKQGLITDDQVYRPEIREDYGWDDIY
mmetsp:Transcript_10443/g.15695  ORF Transcript_10443/g.15695 Transcript_10443/m.15695 type:complete len:169 (-) Transcript_10443:187-693(-)|eukprot:CAMPEP_0202712536 /NCGR_PEP_ID=MMETSP1385-20130828/42448_1 /ASSEMBLY_ACC=CAM_ASM_000861 /TAXON_ID=933848 /ORGANISM="Elphidium margaritaceum" /LENGTH=168 /DNA_ID=CAMNT_0049372607 /DNA_START=47 /DNA_END=553 /DNA_ORIENTATION=-